MMSKLARQHIIASPSACAALLLSGCPPPLGYVVLYNNSGSDYEVLLSKRRVRWRAGSSLRIYEDARRSAREIDWEELVWARFFTLRLESPKASPPFTPYPPEP